MRVAQTHVPLVDVQLHADLALAGRMVSGRARSTHAVVTFFVLTFAWTWGLWGIVALIRGAAPLLGNGLYLVGGFGPSFAACLVILIFAGRAGLRGWLGQCLRWRINWRWYALAVIAPPLILLAALSLHLALGSAIPTSPYADRLLIAILQFLVIVILGGPLGEEFGWRGYALPALTARIGWRAAGALIGVAWALWHLPLLFMADTAQAQLPVVLFIVSTVGLSVVMARLGVLSGFSVLPALLLHSVINWWSAILPVGADTQAYSLVASLAIIVALFALFLPGPKAAIDR